MSDQQPLLNPLNKVSFNDDDDNGNKRQLSANKYHLTKHSDKDTAIGILHMFRFADRLDFLLMFIAACIILIYIFCLLTNLILTGQLAGLFATESFTGDCHHRRPNLIDTIKNNTICPLGIDLNSFNFAHFYKLCYHSNGIVSSTVVASTSTFRKEVMKIVYWLLIIGVGEILSAWMGIMIWMMSLRRQTSKMNILLFQSLVQRNISYFDTTPTNQFNAELFTNIEIIEAGISFEFVVLVATLLCVIGALIVSFVINWNLSLILLCLLIFVVVVSFVLSQIIANETANELKTYSKVGQIVAEVFSSLRTVLSLNGSRYEQKRYENELHQTQWSSVRKGAVFGVLMGWLSLITYIIYPVAFIFGSTIMEYEDHSGLTITDILVIVSVFAPCMTFFGSIGTYFQSYSEARAAAAPVFRLIDEAQDTSINEPDLWREDDASDVGSIADIDHDIEFNNVDFNYPSRKDVSVLRNLSLIARAGQTTALVGSSGCGKSTCVSLLLRQYEVSSGQIKIGDRSITNYNLKHLRQNIGVVSQEPILFGMSIYENIRFGKVNATRAEIEEAARQANAHNFIMLLPNKYETYVGERGIQLSGGEKQRIALARALVKQPSILLLDEATSALDNVSEKIVQEALDQACKNRTTIVVAHRLTTIQNAHHIYVLENGSVLEEGTHETLMAKEGGKYQAMVRIQQARRLSDDLIDIEQVIEEDQQSIFKRTRLLTDSDTADVGKESSTSAKQKSIFLRLLSMSSPEWIIILIGCIICSMNGAIQTVFAILVTKIANAFNYCAHSERYDQVLESSFIFFLLAILLLILRIIQYTTFAISGSKLTERIRLKAFGSLLRQEIAYYDRPENNSRAISVRLSSDASAVEQMVGTRLGVICETFALSCFGLVFGMFFNWQLTMIVFLDFIIIGVIAYLNVKFNGYLKKKSGSILQRANTFAIEVLHNIRTIKQLSVEKEVLRQYSDLIDQVFIASWKPVFVSSMAPSIIWGIDAFALAFLYWRALVLFEKNEMTSDSIIIVFSFATFATQSIKIVGVLSERVGTSLSAAQSFFDLFDRTPSIDNTSSTGQELVDFRGEIEFNQVKFAYPARPTSTVLNKLHLIIKAGQRVALVGTSGCGKSTIIQLLERFYDVTHGQLLLDGIDIRQLNLHWVRSRLGLVSQEPVLFDLTIAENITYGLENVPIESIINAATNANIHQFIEQLPQGYETRVGVKGSFLSGGEKQRIAIARVLLRRPKVLLLDEATSALDSYNERIVQEALEQAQIEDPSRTSLIIAHRLSTIRSCDLICVLDNGRIMESGTHAELIQRHGAYYRMLAQHSS